MDQHILERELAGLHLAEIRYFESLDSTNETAVEWALDGAEDYSLVIANQQEKGKGRVGRRWITIPGAALAFSLLIRPRPQERIQPASVIPRFTGLGAVGVCQTLQTHYGLTAKIKWPNDILVNQRKICGVLAEAQWVGDRLTAVILGVGINIASNAVPRDFVLNFPATSLEAESDGPQDRMAVLRHILGEIKRWRLELMDEKFLRTWEASLAYLGEWVQLTTPTAKGTADSILAEGTIIGLAHDGALRLLTQTGEEQTFRSGEFQIPGSMPIAQENSVAQAEVDIYLRPVDSPPK